MRTIGPHNDESVLPYATGTGLPLLRVGPETFSKLA